MHCVDRHTYERLNVPRVVQGIGAEDAGSGKTQARVESKLEITKEGTSHEFRIGSPKSELMPLNSINLSP